MTKIEIQKQIEKDVANFFIKYFITEHKIDKNSIIPLREEVVLINEAKNGDKKSLDKIINAYRWLINEACVIYRNFYPASDPDILTTKAIISLKKSIVNYKPGASYRFSVYAMEGIALAFGVNTGLADPYQTNL